MLGAIVSWSNDFKSTSHTGLRRRSVFNIIRCPFPHGQSNTSHFGNPASNTSTAPLRGRIVGISSADVTIAATCQRRKCSHDLQSKFMGFARFVLGRGLCLPCRSILGLGDSSGQASDERRFWKSRVRAIEGGPLSDAAVHRSQSAARVAH